LKKNKNKNKKYYELTRDMYEHDVNDNIKEITLFDHFFDLIASNKNYIFFEFSKKN